MHLTIKQIEPFYIWYKEEGIDKRYFPDLLINDELLVEIKLNKRINDKKNLLKFKAARKYCKSHNLIFEI